MELSGLKNEIFHEVTFRAKPAEMIYYILGNETL